MSFTICFTTVSVSSLSAAKEFYEGVLGFEPSFDWAPTRWQAYGMGKDMPGFAIIEVDALKRGPSEDMVDFFVDDVERLWAGFAGGSHVVTPLEHTAWGTHKFVISDPDGNQLGFVQRSTES